MREIKFRAWDKVNLRMIFPAMPTLGGAIEWKGGYDVAGKDYIFMQFTGLCDKNGLMVYEGDILRRPQSQIPYGPNLGTVRFIRTTWIGFFLTDDKESTLVSVPEQCEVIGNIFENPELLK